MPSLSLRTLCLGLLLLLGACGDSAASTAPIVIDTTATSCSVAPSGQRIYVEGARAQFYDLQAQQWLPVIPAPPRFVSSAAMGHVWLNNDQLFTVMAVSTIDTDLPIADGWLADLQQGSATDIDDLSPAERKTLLAAASRQLRQQTMARVTKAADQAPNAAYTIATDSGIAIITTSGTPVARFSAPARTCENPWSHASTGIYIHEINGSQGGRIRFLQVPQP